MLISLAVLPKQSVPHVYQDLKDEPQSIYFPLVRARGQALA